ncbi:MAG: triose-phosphate isomerase [Flammeovirgaceae bacterium]
MRKKIVAGNWKMNLDQAEAQALVSEVVEIAKAELPSDVNLVFCPSFVHLSLVKTLIEGNTQLFLGAQNCSNQPKGAFTGEVSAAMLKSYGVDYVILGHSERRQYFKESNAELAEKVNIALENGLKVIFCCGEVLDEREGNQQEAVVGTQLKESLFHLSPEQFADIVIAYEPVWAIGTGKTASSDQAQEMHAFIRKTLTEKYGEAVAQATTIQYGGSCKPSNAKELFAGADVDGGLIGGASLKARDFVEIGKSY